MSVTIPSTPPEAALRRLGGLEARASPECTKNVVQQLDALRLARTLREQAKP